MATNTPHLQVMFDTSITDDGVPQVVIHVGEDTGDDIEDVGHLAFDPNGASYFAINILHASAYIEAQAAFVMAMRSLKIDEETIDRVKEETDRLTRARRKM